MSMINEELQRQQTKDIGEALRKVLGDKVEVIKPSDPGLIERRITDLNQKIREELTRG